MLDHGGDTEPPPPGFSAVIPTFNREKTVARSVESALDQLHRPEQIIVVDDGSTDGTRAVIESFGSRVQYIYQPNAGVPTARNTGVKAATAEWIAFLDSDDYWRPNHLARTAAAIRATDGRAAFYFSDLTRPSPEGMFSQWARAEFAIEGEYAYTEDATAWVMRPYTPMMLQASAFHRERYLAAGGLWEPLRIRDDTHLFYRLSIGGKACAVKNEGTCMTEDDAGARLTETIGFRTRGFWDCSILMWSDLLERFPELARPHRTLLRQRLAMAHVQLARRDFSDRALGKAFGHLYQGLRAKTTTVAGMAARRLKGSRAS